MNQLHFWIDKEVVDSMRRRWAWSDAEIVSDDSEQSLGVRFVLASRRVKFLRLNEQGFRVRWT